MAAVILWKTKERRQFQFRPYEFEATAGFGGGGSGNDESPEQVLRERTQAESKRGARRMITRGQGRKPDGSSPSPTKKVHQAIKQRIISRSKRSIQSSTTLHKRVMPKTITKECVSTTTLPVVQEKESCRMFVKKRAVQTKTALHKRVMPTKHCVAKTLPIVRETKKRLRIQKRVPPPAKKRVRFDLPNSNQVLTGHQPAATPPTRLLKLCHEVRDTQLEAPQLVDSKARTSSCMSNSNKRNKAYPRNGKRRRRRTLFDPKRSPRITFGAVTPLVK